MVMAIDLISQQSTPSQVDMLQGPLNTSLAVKSGAKKMLFLNKETTFSGAFQGSVFFCHGQNMERENIGKIWEHFFPAKMST